MATIDYSKMSASDIAKRAQELADQASAKYTAGIDASLQSQVSDYETGKKTAQEDASTAGTALRSEYDKYVNPYGVAGEQRAEGGFGNSGYNETLSSNAYAGYLNRRAQNKQGLTNQLTAYDKNISDARAAATQKLGAYADTEYTRNYNNLWAAYQAAHPTGINGSYTPDPGVPFDPEPEPTKEANYWDFHKMIATKDQILAEAAKMASAGKSDAAIMEYGYKNNLDLSRYMKDTVAAAAIKKKLKAAEVAAAKEKGSVAMPKYPW